MDLLDIGGGFTMLNSLEKNNFIAVANELNSSL